MCMGRKTLPRAVALYEQHIALLKNSEVLNELATVLERDGIIIQDYVREMQVLRQVGAVEGSKHRASE